jgi:NADH-quinone oxidoreductase subunit E
MTDRPNQVELSNIIQAAIEKHGAGSDALIPILAEVNQAFGYIPVEALKAVSHRSLAPESEARLSESKLYSVASFYQMFSTKQLGRHVIRFCESAPCHVVGGRELWHSLLDTLKIKSGETTPDGKWSLVTTSCLGVCAVGPVVVVDDDVYGNVRPDQLPEILAKYA